MTSAALTLPNRPTRAPRVASLEPFAALSATSDAVAVAALTFELPAIGDDNRVVIQITPAGAFRPRDGREMTVDAWHIDATSAARVIAQFQRLATPPVLDYEHQTLAAEFNGLPAPAAGFFHALEWRDGAGLFGTVELTARARQYVDAKEYRYFSPVISYDKSGTVTGFVMGALTNNPAIDGMQAIALRAALRTVYSPEETMKTNPLLLAVLTALALPNDTTEEAAIAALSNKTDPLAPIRTALGTAADTPAETLATAVATLKSKANGAAATSVPLETFEQVKTELAQLRGRLLDSDVDAAVKRGLDEGRLLPAQETWARDLGKTNLAALTAYLDATQPIAALSGQQTRGKAPEQGNGAHGLTADEIAVCKATGVTPEAFAKNKNAA